MSPKLARTDVSVTAMSQEGQTARTRATLEGERRWCGNKTEELTGEPLHMGQHKKLCMLLDKRTVSCAHVSREIRAEANEMYEKEYVKFSLQAAKYKSEEVAAAQEASANTAGVSVKEEGHSGQNATASGES